ncbi:DNA cytosine methyltransferase [Chengkuizengella sp. SCS-71B]|uniref:DNA cytosine methyltransferase n=1 Tax=Chengkuizengella sp. SCS-71B TaxID=3115290 RepID=UPI0032C22A36
MKITYDWRLSDLVKVKHNGLNVFSCFSCGGGSTMGYKLAGFNVIGNCEIDPQMMKIYRHNHKPKHSYLMDIREFKKIPNEELPTELFQLDILDGSPPCSTFSMSGQREEVWGKEKKFREGQAKQQLDDLFFDFNDVAEKFKPKVIVAENVVGLVRGNAKGYVNQIIKQLTNIGYVTQIFKLNSATMGVPQRRERIFFISYRKDLNFPKLKLQFNERPIKYKEFKSGKGTPLNPNTKTYRRWLRRNPSDTNIGDITARTEGKENNFNTNLLNDEMISQTLTSNGEVIRYDEPCYISKEDILNIQSFPKDYAFLDASPKYVCGMSVPPLMMRAIAEQIYKQWLK